MRPELTTAALRSSQATHAAVDNSAPIQPARSLFISWGKTVQTSGATSFEIPALETFIEYGIWCERNSNGELELSDYDGGFSLPKEAIELLRKNNITVSKEFE